jgi:hypothetical protein
VLAGQPANQAALAEAGRLFGRIAHLVDAVEDRTADQESGAWNPLLATGTGVAEARRLCDDALLGIKLALREVQFTDDRLVHALLAGELTRSVHRVFAAAAGTATVHAFSGAGGSPFGCGLPAAGLSGLHEIRHRTRCEHCCRKVCCCDACQEACAEGCCEACGEACGGCDCG